jgi:hypothetical protein
MYNMKKTNRNLILSIIVTAIVSTVLVKTAEHYFGMANVFMFAVAIVTIVGVVVVPVMQVRAKIK